MSRGMGSAGARRHAWPNLAAATLIMSWLFGAFALAMTAPARATEAGSAASWQGDGESVRHVVITLNMSKTFHLDRSFATAVVGSPDIVDALPMTDMTLYVQGKKVGTTNVSVYDKGNRLIAVLDVEVAIDTRNLQQKIWSSTGSRSIHVSSSNGQVVLTGRPRDAIEAERAVTLAKSLVPNGVINAMSVATSQQVLLKVHFLEASRDAGRQLGVNWFVGTANGQRGVNTGQGTVFATTNTGQSATGESTANVTPQGLPVIGAAGTLAGVATQPFGVVLANLVNKGTTIDVLVSALESKGLVRNLAEPNLMALSGDTAQFLAGGEFPVPVVAAVSGGLATPSIEYKPFGVRLSFTPTVLSDGIINLRIAPEVSQLDFSNAVTISGTTVPSLIKRDAVTTVELRDGQSFAIAGLLQANDLRNREQIPWLGSVPVLGALFSSMNYQKHETDLVIIVTPHLVQPARPGQKLASPLDSRLPSNDVDFFLNGQMDVKKSYSDYVTSGGDIDGPYGHMIRIEPGSNGPAAKR